MATKYDTKTIFTEDDLELLNNIFNNQTAGTWLAVGSVSISNWIGWERELTGQVFKISRKVYLSDH